jgi:hypothetical protein
VQHSEYVQQKHSHGGAFALNPGLQQTQFGPIRCLVVVWFWEQRKGLRCLFGSTNFCLQAEKKNCSKRVREPLNGDLKRMSPAAEDERILTTFATDPSLESLTTTPAWVGANFSSTTSTATKMRIDSEACGGTSRPISLRPLQTISSIFRECGLPEERLSINGWSKLLGELGARENPWRGTRNQSQKSDANSVVLSVHDLLKKKLKN